MTLRSRILKSSFSAQSTRESLAEEELQRQQNHQGYFSLKSWLMTGYCGFSRISIVVAEFTAWSEFGCCSSNVDGGRLCSFSDDGGGEEECQGFDSKFEQWEIVQSMRDDDAIL